MPESGHRPPDGDQEQPTIKPPQPIEFGYDSASGNNDWWKQDAEKNKFIKAEFDVLQEPPDTMSGFQDWLDKTIDSHAEKMRDKHPVPDLKNMPPSEWEKVPPLENWANAMRDVLRAYGDSLSRWYAVETNTESTDAEKYMEFGAMAELGALLGTLGLPEDQQYIENVFKRIPVVNGAKLSERWDKLEDMSS